MKIIKKALIVTSALALGFIVTGCNKKSIMIDKNKVYNKDNVDRESFKNFDNVLSVDVKKYSNFGSRFIRYITTNNETVVFDYIAKKEIYRTTEEISSVSTLFSETCLLVIFNDSNNTRMVINLDGTILVPRENYDIIDANLIETVSTYKENNYVQYIYQLVTKKAKEDLVSNYYKVTFMGVKNYKNKDVIQDKTNYTLEEISEDSVITYKKGSLYPASKNKYTYIDDNNTIYFYDDDTEKIIQSINYDADVASVILSEDKALVQLFNETTSDDNYDLFALGTYYNYETYVVDLKSGSIKKKDNFGYVISGTDREYIYSDGKDKKIKYILLDNVAMVSNKVIVETKPIIVDNSFKIVQDDNNKAFVDNNYYKLDNGNYIVRDYDKSERTLLLNNNGTIKNVFKAYPRVLFNSKLVLLTDSYAATTFQFIDYNGKKVGDSYKCNGLIVLNDDAIYYQDTISGDIHLLKLDNGMIISDEVIDYKIKTSTYISSPTDVSDASTRYIQSYDYYLTAKGNNTDTDEDFENFDVSYYSMEDELIGEHKNVYSISLSSKTDFTGRAVCISYSIIDVKTNGYTLVIDMLTK